MTVIDTCTLINILNSGCALHIFAMQGLGLCLGESVLEECDSFRSDVDRLISDRTISLVASDEIPIALYTKLLVEENLGKGEAECIAICDFYGCKICTDDGKARKYIVKSYGEERLVGSIGLIKQCHDRGIKSAEQSYRGYSRMISAGGFLPRFNERQFSALLAPKSHTA